MNGVNLQAKTMQLCNLTIFPKGILLSSLPETKAELRDDPSLDGEVRDVK